MTSGASEAWADMFACEAQAAGASVVRVRDPQAAREACVTLAVEQGAGGVVCAGTAELAALDLEQALADRGVPVEIVARGRMDPDELRVRLASAAMGVTDVAFGIAETGTLVLVHGPEHPRAISLLPPVHVALLRVERLVPDLHAWLRAFSLSSHSLPGALTFITGPSRTADIEMVLTRGVHGPAAVHIVLVDE